MSRFGTGLAASAIGCGFLAAGIVTINLSTDRDNSKRDDLKGLIDRCSLAEVAKPVDKSAQQATLHEKAADQSKVSTQPERTDPRASEGAQPPALREKTAERAKVVTKSAEGKPDPVGFDQTSIKTGGDSSTVVSSKEEQQMSNCTTGNRLILVAIAMLLGFSERALTSFEDRIFPTSKEIPKS
jgi:hypothetical protein